MVGSEDMGWLLAIGSMKIIGLFCIRAPYKRLYSAKQTCNFGDPPDRSHPICIYIYIYIYMYMCENKGSHLCECMHVCTRVRA